MRLKPLIALAAVLSLVTPAWADTEWEIMGHAGAGRVFGKGADANRWAGAVAVSGGPRLHALVSLTAFFQVEYLRLRKFAELDDGSGESFIFAVGPQWHVLGNRYRIQPFVGPLVGIAYTRAGVVEGDAEVEFRSRAVVVGGTVGGVYALDDHWAIGLSVVGFPLFVDKACVHQVGDSVSCEAEEDSLNVQGAASAVVKYTF